MFPLTARGGGCTQSLGCLTFISCHGPCCFFPLSTQALYLPFPLPLFVSCIPCQLTPANFQPFLNTLSTHIHATMASPAIKKAITEAAAQYVKPEGKVFQYGTAGVSY